MKMKHYIEARKSRINKIPSSYTIEVAKKPKHQKIKEVEENQPIKNLELDYTVIN
jgi:hypothetical protein